MTLSSFYKSKVTKLAAWLLIAGLILPSCAEMVQNAETNKPTESFLETASKVADEYDSSSELFADIIAELEVKKNTINRLEFQKNVKSYNALSKTSNESIMAQSKASDNARFKRGQGDTNLDKIMHNLAVQNPLGQSIYYKFLAMGMKLADENPEIANLNDTDKELYIKNMLKNMASKSANMDMLDSTNPCHLICYQEFAIETIAASTIFAVAVGACGLSGTYAPLCISITTGIYAVQYAVELGFLWGCIDKCTSDVIEMG